MSVRATESSFPDDTSTNPSTQSQTSMNRADRRRAKREAEKGKKKEQSGLEVDTVRQRTRALLQAPVSAATSSGGASSSRDTQAGDLTTEERSDIAKQITSKFLLDVRDMLAASKAASLAEALSAMNLSPDLASQLQREVTEAIQYDEETSKSPREFVNERLKWKLVPSTQLIPNNSVYTGSSGLIRPRFYIDSLRLLQNAEEYKERMMYFDDDEIEVLERAANKLSSEAPGDSRYKDAKEIVARAKEASRSSRISSQPTHPLISAYEKFTSMKRTFLEIQSSVREKLTAHLGVEEEDATDEVLKAASLNVSPELDKMIRSRDAHEQKAREAAAKYKEEADKQEAARQASAPTDLTHLHEEFLDLLGVEAYGKHHVVGELAKRGVIYY